MYFFGYILLISAFNYVTTELVRFYVSLLIERFQNTS